MRYKSILGETIYPIYCKGGGLNHMLSIYFQPYWGRSEDRGLSRLLVIPDYVAPTQEIDQFLFRARGNAFHIVLEINIHVLKQTSSRSVQKPVIVSSGWAIFYSS